MLQEARTGYRPPSPTDPSFLVRLEAWFDALTDWQRVQYSLAAMVFLVAVSGYLLGLGSTVLLRRVESTEAGPSLAARSVPDLEATIAAAAESTAEPAEPTPAPTPEPGEPTPPPMPAPFTGPEIPDVVVAPRVVAPPPSNRVTAPAPVPTAKPRNLEPSPTPAPRGTVASRTPTVHPGTPAPQPAATTTTGAGAATPTPGRAPTGPTPPPKPAATVAPVATPTRAPVIVAPPTPTPRPTAQPPAAPTATPVRANGGGTVSTPSR